MKNFLILLFIFITSFINGQTCDFGIAKDSIINDNTKIRISTSNQIDIFKNENVLHIWPWIGGVDPGGNLKMAVSIYPTEHSNDYFPGPLNTEGLTNIDQCNAWDKVYKLNREEINTFIHDFQDGKIKDINDIPESILYWPGKGNKYFEEKNGIRIQKRLGNYFDYFADDIYDPLDGDYPLMDKADEAIFWVVNDAGGIHSSSHATPSQNMFVNYGLVYSSHPNPVIANTVFLTSKTYNLGVSEFKDVYYSIYLDYDSRDRKHDKFGTIPEKDAVYMFNQCGFTNNCGNSFQKPDSSITLVKMVESPMIGNSMIGLSSVLGSPFHPYQLYWNANLAYEYYNLMKGFWIDGTPLTYGKSGYNLGSKDTVKFQFDNIQSDSTLWSICKEDNYNNDIRIIMNSGRINVDPGNINKYTYAITMFDIMENPCENIDSLTKATDIIQRFYNNRKSYNPLSSIDLSSNNYLLYPNPTTGKVFIEGKSLNRVKIKIYNLIGKEINSKISHLSDSKVEIIIEDNQFGVYYARILSKDDNQKVIKIILSK